MNNVSEIICAQTEKPGFVRIFRTDHHADASDKELIVVLRVGVIHTRGELGGKG
jgi:hypothetical protein